jgi:hypothetical protein
MNCETPSNMTPANCGGAVEASTEPHQNINATNVIC